MRSESRRRRRPGLRPVIAVAALAVLAGLVPGSWGASPVAAEDPLYTLEVTPSTGLVDGQAVDVIVRAAPGRRVGVSGKLNVCRADTTYETNDDLLPFVGGKCPDKPLSSSASGPWPIRAYPDGSAAVASMRVGTGRVEWGPAENPTQFALTCDAANPCRLVVDVQIEGGPRIIDSSVLLTFADDSPIGTCGGVRPGALSTGGSDRMLGAWIQWTREQCASEGAKASTQAVLAGEGEGHDSFASGLSDLTYSAVGAAFPGEGDPARASVSVPVALNAAVVGILGGYGSTAPDWPSAVPKPYEDVKVTVPELATLFGKGPFLFEATYISQLQQRNAELARGDALTNPSKFNPLAPAGGDAVAYVASTAFDTQASDQWRTPPLNITGNPPDVPRGVHESFALADPPFVSSLFELYSSQAQLKKTVAENEFKPYNYGPIWVLTDLATAERLGIPTVAVQNAAGEFVRPTATSLQAAAATLTPQEDGTFLPDVGTTAPGAYPLTFVEHAVAPAEPLLDDACAPRTESQAVLADWLEYLTGPGQSTLAPGLAPLTPTLAAAASGARAEVGVATPTGDCAPEGPVDPTDPTDPTDPASLPPDSPGAIPAAAYLAAVGGGSVGGSSVPRAGSTGAAGSSAGSAGVEDVAGVPEDDAAPGETATATLISEVDRPDLPGGRAPGWLAGAFSLVALAVLGAIGGMASSGRPLRLPGRRG